VALGEDGGLWKLATYDQTSKIFPPASPFSALRDLSPTDISDTG
jgi:hypothetical protein